MKEILESGKEYLIEKFGNPFAGTFIVSWSILHWRLLFTLFNFDPSYTLDEKISCLDYYLHGGVCDFLITPILYALSAIAIYHILLNTSNLIIRFFNRHVKPRVYKIVGSGDVIDIDTHKEVERLYRKSLNEYDELSTYSSNVNEKNKLLQERNEKMNATFLVNTKTMQDQIFELSDIRNKLALKDQEIANLKTSHEDANTFFDHLFEGQWELDYHILQKNEHGTEPFEIKNREYIIRGNPNHKFKIEDITWNQETRRLCFYKVGDSVKRFNELQVDPNNALLTGTENTGWSTVKYTKKHFDISKVLKAL